MDSFRTRCSKRRILLTAALALATCVTTLAQGPTYQLGRSPSPEEIKARDIAISPEGKELPPGHGTAVEGAAIYNQKCAACHGPNATGSALHRGLDTDRVFVEWWVRSQQVAYAQNGIRHGGKPEADVEVPRDIEIIKKRDMAEAQRWQAQVRSQFQKLLAEGLYCAGFEADPSGGNSRYLFFKDEHQEEEEE